MRGLGNGAAGKVGWVLLAFWLGLAWAQGPRAALAPREAEGLLQAWGYTYERRERGGQVYYALRMAGVRALLLLLDCSEGGCSSLQLYAVFGLPDKLPLERINEWNRRYRFSRSYLDEDGDPVLEADLDLTGGVADAAIRNFLQTFELSLRTFMDWIGFRGGR
ncbi:MAG: YbjN domain-containing protein [Thermus sp.]|uniref:YbjN domain-containing protein n=1 Tax=Thermus sp. TaxID=275 RepID=UPI0025FF2AB4|nr:YbjN domain-containing protein [Thermus sp.]MCS7218328.1 YbjN domain-containing protein [Thermus sp.]